MMISGRVPFNRVVLKTIDVEKSTKSGIIISGTGTEKENKSIEVFQDHPFQGLVIALGEGLQNWEVPLCKVGDIVLIKPGSTAYQLNDRGTMYTVISDTDILLVREAEEENA